jgi:Putative peptidoglycan binding domain
VNRSPTTRLGARLGCALALVVSLGALAPAAALGARASVPQAFAGEALWVNNIAFPQTGRQLVSEAAGAGARTLYVKAAEGSSAELQFSAVLVGEMRAAGARVCAWTFARGQDPVGEAAAAVAAVRDGSQCLVIDAEGEYDKLYGAAQLFVRTLRARLGASFPIGLASQAEVAQHPSFPYSVFLGPGGFNAVLPQIYWLDFGVSVDAAYAATIGGNAIYGRPILPLGQLYGSPSTTELTRFRALARAYDDPGSSFFDLDVAQPQELAALRMPAPRLPRRAVVASTLRAGACGDEIVQAQELLNAAGAHLPVGGFFGAETARAVSAFQARHRLPPSGVLGPATWRALASMHPREPSWASGPPACER